MTPKGKMYHPDYASELLEIAAGDLASAKGLLRIAEGRPENICYMAQQCAEKSLKAVLCFLRQPVVLTHDLDALISHLPDKISPPHAHQAGALTEYSLIRRYEQGYAILGQADIQLAINLAEDILKWAQNLVRGASPAN